MSGPCNGAVSLQREKAREGARRAVEAAGRAGDQPQAAAGGRGRRARAAQVMLRDHTLHPRPRIMRLNLFSAMY